MKNNNWCDRDISNTLISEKATKKIWGSAIHHVVSTLRRVNINYLTPQHFFALTSSLVYHPYEKISESKPGQDFFLETQDLNQSIFFITCRYWITFYFANSEHYIPHSLFGFLWSMLSYRKNSEIMYWKFLQNVIKVTTLLTTSSSSTDLYQSGHEYVAITGTLSAILRDAIDGRFQTERYAMDCTLIEFFLEMTNRPPFTWENFCRTKENACRLEYLLRYIIWFMLQDHEDCRQYIRKKVEMKKDLSLTKLQRLCVDRPHVAMLRLMVNFWYRFTAESEKWNSFPTNAMFCYRNTPLKPIPARWTMYLTRDPISKNENRVVIFVQFHGIHPAYWHTCSKSELQTMTPHAIHVDLEFALYQKECKLLFPVGDFTSCKLNRPKRVNAIRAAVQQGLPMPSDVSYEPWWDHEWTVFPFLRQVPDFVFKKRISAGLK